MHLPCKIGTFPPSVLTAFRYFRETGTVKMRSLYLTIQYEHMTKQENAKDITNSKSSDCNEEAKVFLPNLDQLEARITN